MTLQQAYDLGFQKAAEHYGLRMQKSAAAVAVLQKAAQQSAVNNIVRTIPPIPWGKTAPTAVHAFKDRVLPSFQQFMDSRLAMKHAPMTNIDKVLQPNSGVTGLPQKLDSPGSSSTNTVAGRIGKFLGRLYTDPRAVGAQAGTAVNDVVDAENMALRHGTRIINGLVDGYNSVAPRTVDQSYKAPKGENPFGDGIIRLRKAYSDAVSRMNGKAPAQELKQ